MVLAGGCRALAFGILFGCAVNVVAQNIPRIGFIGATSQNTISTRIAAFRQGLKNLGYVEGKNIVVEYRWSEGRDERLATFAAELEQLRVAVIVTGGPLVTRVVRQATKSTPIVMAFDSDPVSSGFVDSLARPGGRITGLSVNAAEMSGKQVDVLRQIIPGFSRLAVLGDSKEPSYAHSLEQIKHASAALGLRIQPLDVRASHGIEEAFAAARRERTQAMIVLPSAYLLLARSEIVTQAEKQRLPVMYWAQDYVDAGGLVSYSANIEDLYRRAAIYVDKILKGAKPGELAVEQPYKFELVVSVKAAKRIGLTIPMSVLTRADRVIQ